MSIAGNRFLNYSNKMAIKTDEQKKRSIYIRKVLESLYPNPKPPLVSDSPFQLLVAVALSAQTTDVQVNIVTPALFKRAKDARAMAKLSAEEILSFIRTCGLAPTKAKNVKRLSEMLVEKHGGEVPNTFEALEELPGVGHKTASVVMSQVFHIPAFPVDTHIHRLAKRWKLSNGKSVEQTEADLKRIFPEKTWNDLHLQIIYYGREFCTARLCNGHTCRICAHLNGAGA